jgi:hypothetical protein
MLAMRRGIDSPVPLRVMATTLALEKLRAIAKTIAPKTLLVENAAIS